MDSHHSRTLAAFLGRLASEGADVAQITAATESWWRDIENALTPIIGTKGVGALYARSASLVRVKHPWFTGVAAQAGAAHPGHLRTLFAQQDTTAAAAAAAAGDHLEAFYELLCSLIGLPLTDQLLRPVWNTSLDDTRAKKVSP